MSNTEKNERGRPPKTGKVLMSFTLAPDVAAILRGQNKPGERGAATAYVEDAVREKHKREQRRTK